MNAATTGSDMPDILADEAVLSQMQALIDSMLAKIPLDAFIKVPANQCVSYRISIDCFDASRLQAFEMIFHLLQSLGGACHCVTSPVTRSGSRER